MRGFVEPRTLATVISRSRGPSCSRSYSGGIGRGRGGGFGNFADSEDSLFDGSYGHGVPLNPPSAGRGGPLNAGRGGHVPGAAGSHNGPLLSNLSFGRGSGYQRPTEESDFHNKPPVRPPSLNLGTAGFGRGKPLEKVEPQEELFSSERKGILSSWSKWDEKAKKFSPKDRASPAELRLLGEDGPTDVLPAPQQQQELGQTRGWQSPPGVPSPWAAPDQQPSSTSPRAEWRFPPGVPPPRASPIQQPAPQPPWGGVPLQPPPFHQPGWQYSGGFQASPVGPPVRQSPGGGLPIQAPPQQAKGPGWQVPFDPMAQPQPFSSHVPPTTGWQQQPPQEPYVQPPPFVDYSAPPTAVYTGWQQQAASMEEHSSYEFADDQATSSRVGAAEAYNTGAPSHFSAYESQWVQGGPGPSYSEPHSVNQEAHQPAWAESTPEMSQQARPDYQLGDWSHGSTSDTMQGTTGPQYSSQQGQGQYISGSGMAQAPSLTSQPSSVSYDYDWGQPTQEELASADVSIHADTGLDYDQRIEECYEQGKLEDMDAIFGEMKAANVRANSKTYDTLMRSYIQLQRMDKVSEVYTEMRREVVSNNKSQSDNVKESPIMAVGGAHQEVGHKEGQEVDLRKPEAAPSFTNTKGFATSGSSSPSAKAGMGRGKKAGGFFDFDFSGSLGVGGESSEVHQEVKSEMPDDYSQTFKPVIQPGLLNFSQEGLSVGPGAGRGRPQSPQAREFGLGSGLSFQASPFDSGIGRGTTSSYSYGQDMQQEPPLYSRDKRTEQYGDYSPEPSEPSLDEEEAAERAMSILNQRMSRRYSRLQDWGREYYDDEPATMRRSPIQLAQAKVPKEKKQRKKPAKLEEEEKKLTDATSKEEAARLKAIEQNETIEELQGILDSFLKCYGEMALEPEHELGDFTNPDIDEKAPMSLEEYLEKAKPNIMKTGLIAGEKQWQRMVKEALKNADHFEEFVERHSGPGRYTAKEENEDLEEIASTLPSDVGRGAKAFVQRSLITLKSNPGFNLDEKQWMLANMVDTFAQFPAKT